MENPQDHQPTFDSIYKRNKTIYQALTGLKDAANGRAYNYMPFESNDFPRLITRLQGIYRQLLGEMEEMSFLDEEGAVEVTIRSRSKTLTLPLSKDVANQVTEALVDSLKEQLCDVMNRILTARQRLASGDIEDDLDRIRFQTWLLDPVPLSQVTGNPDGTPATNDQAA